MPRSFRSVLPLHSGIVGQGRPKKSGVGTLADGLCIPQRSLGASLSRVSELCAVVLLHPLFPVKRMAFLREAAQQPPALDVNLRGTLS